MQFIGNGACLCTRFEEGARIGEHKCCCGGLRRDRAKSPHIGPVTAVRAVEEFLTTHISLVIDVPYPLELTLPAL